MPKYPWNNPKWKRRLLAEDYENQRVWGPPAGLLLLVLIALTLACVIGSIVLRPILFHPY